MNVNHAAELWCLFLQFRMDMQMDQEEGLYNLIFHNCRMRGVDTGVSFVVSHTLP